jgi:hypothetical protein
LPDYAPRFPSVDVELDAAVRQSAFEQVVVGLRMVEFENAAWVTQQSTHHDPTLPNNRRLPTKLCHGSPQPGRETMTDDQWVMLEEPEPTEREKLFAEAHKKMTERIKQYEKRIVTVLRAHLAAEQSLNYLLTVARRRKKGRTFSGKWWVAKGLFVKEMTEELWEVLRVGNDLRNAVGHGDKQGVIEAKIVELRKAFTAANTPQQKKYIEEMTEEQMITMAFSHCSSHITVAADRIEREGK